MARQLTVFMVCLVSATPAFAYRTATTLDGVPLHWDKSQSAQTITIVSAGLPVTSETMTTMVNNAFATWAKITSDVPTVTVAAVVDTSPATTVNQVVVDSTWNYAPDALAETVYHYDETSGQLFNATIHINGTGPCFDLSTSTACYDLQSILTHEAGHFLGLAHTPNDPDAIMVADLPANTVRLTPSADDSAGVLSIYNQIATLSAADVQANQTSGGCHSTPTGDWSLLFAVVLVALYRRAADRDLTDKTFG